MENKLITIEGEKYLAIPIPSMSWAQALEDYDLEVEGRVKGYDFKFRKRDVIHVLDKQRHKLKDYRTTCLIYHNRKFSLKSLFEILTKIPRNEYNTVQIERYFKELGFEIHKMR